MNATRGHYKTVSMLILQCSKLLTENYNSFFVSIVGKGLGKENNKLC